MTHEKWQELLAEAKTYAADEFDIFVTNLEWQDWMDEYVEAEDGEELSEMDFREIYRIERQIFDLAHHDFFCDACGETFLDSPFFFGSDSYFTRFPTCPHCGCDERVTDYREEEA